ncbi:MAG: TolC family protein, partial [bacterium]|nr:TolC family protein [bacterium]
EIISNKTATVYDLSDILNKKDEKNLDIKQKKYLVDAAKRATVAAYLKYLPTLRLDLGYQSYNEGYAKSYTDVPTHVGAFTIGMDQMIYSPDLVTNIIVKHKKLKFDKAEKVLTEQSIGLQLADLYIDTLMLENAVKIQEEHLTETRENLAIARVREKSGFCGREEALQWAGEVSQEEKKLLAMKADLNNVKIEINKLLNKDQREEFTFKPLTASDPAFFSSDIHILDHVRTPEKLAKFTDMISEEAIYLSPETTKLKAAIAMKKAEIGNYSQKFFLPNAKLTLEHTSQFNRSLPYEKEGHMAMQSAYLASAGMLGSPWLGLDEDSTRFMIVAQWKPIEGGTKFAEIARCKSELNQLNTYLDEVNTEIEMNIRSVINRAISKYFMIEKSYKAMFAQTENYQMVKNMYLQGKAPISQLATAQNLYTEEKLNAMNSQYEFFKELLWVQRGLISVNWTKALPEAKDFITKKVPKELEAEPDFSL